MVIPDPLPEKSVSTDGRVSGHLAFGPALYEVTVRTIAARKWRLANEIGLEHSERSLDSNVASFDGTQVQIDVSRSLIGGSMVSSEPHNVESLSLSVTSHRIRARCVIWAASSI